MILAFAMENLPWVVMASLASSGLAWTFARDNAQTVDTGEAVLLVNREKGVVVDLRSAADFAKGKISQSRNIPAVELKKRTADIERYRERPVILVCQQGPVARRHVRDLTAQGFSHVKALQGGMDAWLRAQLPVLGKNKEG
ncbi:rhodanese-like domain-containing protein [Candidatus Persebacteraceae bacterium Df01]|jgi:rhodanese-related sulfurtransferase|uniref:Rhodanese-like domain-containing protein n=1 Tax=Candidatus Doriopsillibacter californiensis TaxID=2970740 RepID=A0ABT7QKU9_9GAMM|nr:rhodanese-like domain-containing protein [Candidatus Persebacteraceae bacterium Df01]